MCEERTAGETKGPPAEQEAGGGRKEAAATAECGHSPDASLAARAGGRKAVSGCEAQPRPLAAPSGTRAPRGRPTGGGPAPSSGLGLSRGCSVAGGGARRLPGRLRHPWSPLPSQRTGAWVRGPVVPCGSGTLQRPWSRGPEFPLLAPRRTAGSHYRPSPFTSAPRAGGSRRPGEGRVIINPRPEIPPEGP